MRERRGMLAVSAAGVLWGTLGLVVRLLQDAALPTVVIAFWRLALATTVLALVVGRPGLHALRAEGRPWRLLAVGVCFAVFQLSYFVGVRDAGVAVATLVTLGVAPIAATAWEAVRDRRPPSTGTLVTLGCAIAGLALVSTASGVDETAAPRPGLGIAASLVSGLAYTTSATLSGPLSRRLSPFVITAATSAVALALVAPFAIATGIAVPLDPRVLGGLAWLGLVTTALAYGLFYGGLATTPGSVAVVLTLLEPATAVVLAVLVLAEPATPAGVAGTLLLLGAVALLYLSPASSRPRAEVPPPA
jgi:DME family drug/metabolite transporter